MKKIILILSFLFSLVASAQVSPPVGYTGINFRYDWIAGKFEAVNIPGFNTTPSFKSGQWPHTGGLGVDSSSNSLWFSSGTTWYRVAKFTEIGSNQYVDSIFKRNDSIFYNKSGTTRFVAYLGQYATQTALNDTAAAIRAIIPPAHGIDDVLAIGQQLTTDRLIDGNGHGLEIDASQFITQATN